MSTRRRSDSTHTNEANKRARSSSTGEHTSSPPSATSSAFASSSPSRSSSSGAHVYSSAHDRIARSLTPSPAGCSPPHDDFHALQASPAFSSSIHPSSSSSSSPSSSSSSSASSSTSATPSCTAPSSASWEVVTFPLPGMLMNSVALACPHCECVVPVSADEVRNLARAHDFVPADIEEDCDPLLFSKDIFSCMCVHGRMRKERSNTHTHPHPPTYAHVRTCTQHTHTHTHTHTSTLTSSSLSLPCICQRCRPTSDRLLRDADCSPIPRARLLSFVRCGCRLCPWCSHAELA
jgi:hypothetical protein